MKNTVLAFLDAHGMSPRAFSIRDCRALLVSEMEKGLAGQPSSLMMLPSYLSAEGELPRDKTAVAIDAGGTNLRIAAVRFDGEGRAATQRQRVYPLPGTKGEIGAEEFFDTLAAYIEPVADAAGSIGFCFSFPAEVMPDRDGRILKFNKEVKVADSAGRMLCASLQTALERRGLGGRRSYVLLNDTTATLLGGLAAQSGRDFESGIGFILGTGVNSCYSEPVSGIKKCPGLGGGSMVINMEMGSFDKMSRGDFDRDFDATTDDPGFCLYEKMVSGAYLGGVITMCLRGAAAAGLLSSGFAAALAAEKLLGTTDVDAFLRFPRGGGRLAAMAGGDRDREAAFYVCDALLERTAKLVTTQLGGIFARTGQGRDPLRPVCIAAEGSTFYKCYGLRDRIARHMAELAEAEGFYYDFTKAEDANMIGTAAAVLLNP